MYKEQLEKEIKVHKMLLESKEISQYEKDGHYDNLQDATAELRGYEIGRKEAIRFILKLVNSEIKQELKAKEDKLVRDWDIVKELKTLAFLIRKQLDI